MKKTVAGLIVAIGLAGAAAPSSAMTLPGGNLAGVSQAPGDTAEPGQPGIVTVQYYHHYYHHRYYHHHYYHHYYHRHHGVRIGPVVIR